MGTLIKTGPTYSNEWPSLFDDLFTRELFNYSNGNQAFGNTLPAVNLRETNSNYEIEVAAPGMSKKDFHVELDNNMLVISAEMETKNSNLEEKNEYTRREFSYQSFKRSFNLPENTVMAENISAKYKDGILQITVPKSEEAKVKPARQIQIS